MTHSSHGFSSFICHNMYTKVYIFFNYFCKISTTETAPMIIFWNYNLISFVSQNYLLLRDLDSNLIVSPLSQSKFFPFILKMGHMTSILVQFPWKKFTLQSRFAGAYLHLQSWWSLTLNRMTSLSLSVILVSDFPFGQTKSEIKFVNISTKLLLTRYIYFL